MSTFLRPLLVIPSWLIDRLLAGTTLLPLVLMLLFRKKYPRWWFDFNLERARVAARVGISIGGPPQSMQVEGSGHGL